VSELAVRALFTKILFSLDRIPVFSQMDHRSTPGTQRRLVSWWVGQFLEVVLVRPIVNIQFGLERLSALRTFLPLPLVSLVVMIAAQGITAVVPMATVPGIREQDVLVLVIANPLPATSRFRQPGGFAA
jgi:hypothetical protein